MKNEPNCCGSKFLLVFHPHGRVMWCHWCGSIHTLLVTGKWRKFTPDLAKKLKTNDKGSRDDDQSDPKTT